MIPRILIVDDNPEIHSDFRKILTVKDPSAELSQLEALIFGDTLETESEPERYALDFASQGAEAIDMVRSAIAEGKPYGMAFVDVRMPPGLDGVQTIGQIRKIDPQMQFTVCSAYSDYTPEEASVKVGLSNGLLFVIKPFDTEIIRNLARTMSTRPALGGESPSSSVNGFYSASAHTRGGSSSPSPLPKNSR